MKITFVCDDRLFKETGGIYTFYRHLKTMCDKNKIAIEVYTPNLFYEGKDMKVFDKEQLRHHHDIIISNDLRAVTRTRACKCNIRINYNHLGDLHVFGHSEYKDASFDSEYNVMYLRELREQGSVYVSQQGQVDDFKERGIAASVLPMPFYPEVFDKPEQDGIAFASTDCDRKNLQFLIDNVPESIQVGLYCFTERDLPMNFKNSVVPNTSVQRELAKYKMLILPSTIDTYGYVLLEAMQYTRPVIVPHYWNRELPFDRVETQEDIVKLYNSEYKPVFDIHEYSKNTEKKWIELFKGGDQWRS